MGEDRSGVLWMGTASPLSALTDSGLFLYDSANGGERIGLDWS